MTTEDVPKTAHTNKPPARQRDSRAWRWRFWVVVVVLTLFAVLAGVMILIAGNADETVWQRRVFIFSAAQAIVFTAVGWLFGREVNQAAVDSAQKDAAGAKQDAANAREEAKKQADGETSAKLEATAERTRGETIASVIKNSRIAGSASSEPVSGYADASASSGQVRQPATVVDLQAVVRDLYG